MLKLGRACVISAVVLALPSSNTCMFWCWWQCCQLHLKTPSGEAIHICKVQELHIEVLWYKWVKSMKEENREGEAWRNERTRHIFRLQSSNLPSTVPGLFCLVLSYLQFKLPLASRMQSIQVKLTCNKELNSKVLVFCSFIPMATMTVIKIHAK